MICGLMDQVSTRCAIARPPRRRLSHPTSPRRSARIAAGSPRISPKRGPDSGTSSFHREFRGRDKPWVCNPRLLPWDVEAFNVRTWVVGLELNGVQKDKDYVCDACERRERKGGTSKGWNDSARTFWHVPPTFAKSMCSIDRHLAAPPFISTFFTSLVERTRTRAGEVCQVTLLIVGIPVAQQCWLCLKRL